MSELSLRHINPPQFIICDDIRTEVGGKRTLVGVYPGNIVSVPNEFPREVVLSIWSSVYSTKARELSWDLRVVRCDDRATTFVDTFTASAKDISSLVPCTFRVFCQVSKVGRLEVQIRAKGDTDWLALGTFEVILQSP